MRARLACVCVFVLIGCTRDNPAFDLAGDTEAETSPETADTQPDPEETGGSSEEGEDPVCELVNDGTNLDISMPFGCSDDPYIYEKWMKVTGFDGAHSWLVEGCNLAGCGECQPGQVPLRLTVKPMPVSALAGADACLHVFAGRRMPMEVNSCEYQTTVIWEVVTGQHALVLVGDGAIDVDRPGPDGGAPGSPPLTPVLVQDEICTCEEFPGDCCDGNEPTRYELDVETDAPVPIGEQEIVTLDGFGDLEFWNLNSFQTGDCGDHPPDVSWALTRLLP